MIHIRKSGARGHANHGWLDTYHTFSFADYYDPGQMGFRSLRVINEDRVAGGAGFDLHPHRDMEIITYVLTGALQHRDSLGNTAVIKAGEVQRLTAGTGIIHSEYNYSPVDPVHFLQIWIFPQTKGLRPGYEQKSFAGITPGSLHLVAAPKPHNGAVKIHQNVQVFLGMLEQGQQVQYQLAPGRYAWVQLAQGEIQLNGQKLKAGDGAAVSEETNLEIIAQQAAQVILFDLL